VTIVNSGTVTTSSGIGIFAGTGTGLATTGNGIISISNSGGAITSLGSANNPVIQINNNSSQGATFTNSGTVTAKLFSASSLNVAVGANNGNIATNTGAVTVNNTGTISGNVALGTSPFNISAATFNNNIGGVWNVNGSNWFGGLANTISNSGTMNIAAFSSFFSAIGSTFALNNSGTVNVLANSAADIGAAVSGSGSFIINNRAELEFAGSVAGGPTGPTVSFAAGATGVLTLDNPSAFAGTISGLAIGDTIDFLGGVVVSGASISGPTLTVSTNIGNLNYTVSGAQSGTMFNVLSADKIVMVPTSALTVSGQTTPYSNTGAIFYIFSNDTISGTGAGINIASLDNISTDYLTVNFNQTTSISVTGNGVNLTTAGANIAFVGAGNITSSGGIGINTNSGSGSTDIIDYSSVSGSIGIDVHTSGSGPLNIVVGGGITTITGTTSYGILAISTLGVLDLNTLPGVTVHSGSAGIVAENQGSSVPSATNSSISVSTSGTINSGSAATGSGNAPAGILVGYLGGTSATPNPLVVGNVSVNNAANITALAGSGITAFNYGKGDLSVSDGQGTTITATAAGNTNGTPGFTQYGISAFDYGSGSVTVTIAFGSIINSGGTGLQVGNQAPGSQANPVSAGPVTVVALGAINSGANSNNSSSAPAGIQAGFNPGLANVFNPNVAGNVFVNDSGSIVAAAGEGINAYNYGVGNIAVNLGFGASITALNAATAASGNAPL
jgi:hypothetical protein